MINSSSSTYGTLFFTLYSSLDSLRYMYLLFPLLLYFVTVFANVFLMLVIYLEPGLHKPMYIFIFNLALNGLYGSSAFYLKLMDNLLSGGQESSYIYCLVQVFCVTTYGAFTFTILAVMAYDRHVSICQPLQYYSIMTPAKVKGLLTGAYLLPVSGMLIHITLTGRLPLCRFTIHKLFCDNWAVVKLSCVNTNANNVFGLFLTVVFAAFPFVVVLHSYVQILLVCFKATKEAQRKALSTCAPHLITFINFTLASLFSVIYNRFDYQLPTSINVFMSVHFIVIPPLLHPIIYGIRTQDIWKSILKIFRKTAVDDKPRVPINKMSLAAVMKN